VIEWERRVRLRHYLEEGLSQRAIARKLGISRRTIHRWIQSGQLDRELSEPPSYSPRPPVPTKLDPYKSIITERLDTYPQLSAVRLFEEVQAAGYPGGYTQVKEYVRKVRPRPPEEDANRFETPPGKQGQVDFAHFKVPWGRRYALLVVLGWARHAWVRFYPRQDMPTLIRGLEEAFVSFGGVPRELLFDQMKSVVAKDLRQESGPLVENAEFLRFAHHWGFRIRACRPYRARTKGKVERPIRYLRENFFYGRTFTSDSDLNHQVQRWLDDVANVRIHGTTKERPVDRLERERAKLRPLASRPYRSLVLPVPKKPSKVTPLVPRVGVERRSLDSYARIAAGGGR
jgi:transposase